MVAGGKRAVANHIATPVILTGHYRLTPSSFKNSWTFWRGAPWGFQVFRHVPLQVDGVMFLWGSNNAKAGAVYPEQIPAIAVNQKFETLYVLHGTFYYTSDNTPIYDLVFRYENGESATNTLRYGVHTRVCATAAGKPILAPSGPNSKGGLGGASFTQDGEESCRFSA